MARRQSDRRLITSRQIGCREAWRSKRAPVNNWLMVRVLLQQIGLVLRIIHAACLVGTESKDVMLWRVLQHVADGFYIDVGAADPASLSVTRIFYERGWHGINMEPNPAYFEKLRKSRPHDINLMVGVSRAAGQSTFYNIEGSGLSTFDPAIAERHQAAGWQVAEQTVETVTLAEVCRRHRREGPIHFLKIDVEGSEHDVLAGADFTAFRPWIVVVEAVLPLSQEASHAEWEPLLISNGYSFVWFDGLNRFYLSDETKSDLGGHFRVPPNVFDNFVPSPALLERAEKAEQGLRDAEVIQTSGSGSGRGSRRR